MNLYLITCLCGLGHPDGTCADCAEAASAITCSFCTQAVEPDRYADHQRHCFAKAVADGQPTLFAPTHNQPFDPIEC